jgi:hypothetical protein
MVEVEDIDDALSDVATSSPPSFGSAGTMMRLTVLLVRQTEGVARNPRRLQSDWRHRARPRGSNRF